MNMHTIYYYFNYQQMDNLRKTCTKRWLNKQRLRTVIDKNIEKEKANVVSSYNFYYKNGGEKRFHAKIFQKYDNKYYKAVFNVFM